MTGQTDPDYIGRFAPSPTGPLHMGSLVAALASFLDAKHHHGLWHVRVEDLDPPREQRGATSQIINALEAHQLFWDGPILYQSQRSHCYISALETLKPHLYRCDCTRQRLRELTGIYDGYCRDRAIDDNTPAAIRLRIDRLSLPLQALAESFTDLFIGRQHQCLATAVGDFILQRKDQLFAYQLAVVVDDIQQGITHIIRGADLLDSTVRQRYLYLLLDASLPQFGHIPLVLNEQGQKMSKQNLAPALDNRQARQNLCDALAFLNHTVPDDIATDGECAEILRWATEHWDRQQLIPSI